MLVCSGNRQSLKTVASLPNDIWQDGAFVTVYSNIITEPNSHLRTNKLAAWDDVTDSIQGLYQMSNEEYQDMKQFAGNHD